MQDSSRPVLGIGRVGDPRSRDVVVFCEPTSVAVALGDRFRRRSRLDRSSLDWYTSGGVHIQTVPSLCSFWRLSPSSSSSPLWQLSRRQPPAPQPCEVGATTVTLPPATMIACSKSISRVERPRSIEEAAPWTERLDEPILDHAA